jgi:hypothetical protein
MRYKVDSASAQCDAAVVSAPESPASLDEERGSRAQSYREVLRHPPLLTLVSGDAISRRTSSVRRSAASSPRSDTPV